MFGSFLGNLTGIFYYLAFQFFGIFIINRVIHTEKTIVRILLGSVFGSIALQWLPLLFAIFFKFTILSHILALLLFLIIAIIVCLKLPSQKLNFKELNWNDIKIIALILPVFVYFAITLSTHTIPMKNGAMHAGQCTYGDMNMHLGFITSIANQGFFPPEYSILPGSRLAYPFLCDSISSSVYIFGSSLRLAYMLPMLFAALQTFLLFYVFAISWLKSRAKATLAWVLFFINGGFGFIYFLDGLKENNQNFTRIFTSFYETPTNLFDKNVRWVNVIVDMMIPQRATLFGWAVLFACLVMLYKAVYEKKPKLFYVAAVFAGALPMIHTHSFFALGLICAGWLLMQLIKDLKNQTFKIMNYLSTWGIFLAVVLVLALPQLLTWTFRQAGNEEFIRPHFNWDNRNDNYFWYYIKNIGVVAVLLLPALFAAKKDMLKVVFPAAIIWLIAELIVFQPNPYDNNKLLYPAYSLLVCVVADYMINCYKKLKDVGGHRIIAVIVIFFCTISGLLSMGREIVSDYQLYGNQEVNAAVFIEKNTPADAVILTDFRHNNAISSLTGRNIVCGSDVFLYYHGFKQITPAKRQAAKRMFENPRENYDLFTEYNVDYIMVGPYERGSFHVDEGTIAELFPRVYSSGGVSFYAVSDRAKALYSSTP